MIERRISLPTTPVLTVQVSLRLDSAGVMICVVVKGGQRNRGCELS